MTQPDLIKIMLFQLQYHNGDGSLSLPEDTIHETVLSASDGFGPANSKNIYRDSIILTLSKAKQEIKHWPSDWMKLSVKDLASKLLMFLFLILPFFGKSQLQATLGASKSELRDNAVTIGVTYLKSFDSIWKNSQYVFVGKNSTMSLNPELSMQTGTEDAFSSINVKVTGLVMKFKTTKVGGFETVDPAKIIQTFPVSIGAETNNLFNTLNGLVEVGWVPWYRTSSKNEIIKRTKFGVFMQGGYKFHLDSTGKTAIGGEIDQSDELPKRAIARVKGSFGVDTKNVIKVNNLDVGIVGTADLWYDFINGAVYHKIDARGRFYLDQERYIDLIYQKGSGAPNFNQGDQFGVGLTITF